VCAVCGLAAGAGCPTGSRWCVRGGPKVLARSHAEHVRPTTDGRQGATMHLNDKDALQRRPARAPTRHAWGRASRARESEIGEFGGALRPQGRRDGLWAAAIHVFLMYEFTAKMFPPSECTQCHSGSQI
jgi:hypothetical protein